MRVLIVFAHFSEESLSHHIYTHAIRHLARLGHQVKARNLYKIGFDPVLSSQDLAATSQGRAENDLVGVEQRHIRWAQVLLFIYPIWWSERPAILKGWFDRVFTRGFAFHYGPKGVEGLLSDKKGLAIQLTGMPQNYPFAVEKSYMFQNSLLEGSLAFCGVQQRELLTLYNTFYMKPQEAVLLTKEVEAFLSEQLPSL